LTTSKEVGLEVYAEKTKYMLLSHHQNAWQNHDIKIANRSFENVVQFRCLDMTATNQNLIQQEIKRLNSDNACSVQNFLSSHLLAKDVKIRIYKTIILPVVLYGCEAWSLTLRVKHRLRVFENRVLRIFGLKGDEVMGDWRKLHNEELHTLYSSPNTIRMIKSRRMRWAGRVAQVGRRGMHIEYWWENQNERDH
jgi:hypothetical protein